MGKMARDKGARGEREVIDLLQPIVDNAYRAAGKDPPQLKRTSSMQADGGGCDVHGIDWLALEVKRCETLHLDAWWRQCLGQAKSGQLPVLVYRQNGRQWRARFGVLTLFPRVAVVADVSIDDFMLYFEACLRVSPDICNAKRALAHTSAGQCSCGAHMFKNAQGIVEYTHHYEGCVELEKVGS